MVITFKSVNQKFFPLSSVKNKEEKPQDPPHILLPFWLTLSKLLQVLREKQNKSLTFSRVKLKQRVSKIKEKQNFVYRQYKEIQLYGKKRHHTAKTESNKVLRELSDIKRSFKLLKTLTIFLPINFLYMEI